jgi:hypothetical protein
VPDQPIGAAAPADRCRLCGGALRRIFGLQVLEKYAVNYLRCAECLSLQTERPYWIGEAYTNSLAKLDTGAAQRTLVNLAAAYAVARILRLNDLVDFGGGDGLLCRLLRDYRVNCLVYDKYAKASYAPNFVAQSLSQARILLAFEVFEHFENPREDFRALLGSNIPAVLASTAIFQGQGPDWWYLSPETGQHVFFYSVEALRLIASTYGYELLICSGHILLLKPGLAGRSKRLLLKCLLQKHALRLVGAAMRLLPARGVWQDFEALRAPQDGGSKRHPP